MKTIERRHAFLFVGGLSLIALMINGAVRESEGFPARSYKTTREPAVSPAVTQTASPAPNKLSRADYPIITRGWPVNASPTRVIPFNDRNRRQITTSEEITVQPGEDVQFEIDPFWIVSTIGLPPTVEVAIDDGNGFLSPQNYQEKHARLEDGAADPRWINRRIARYRLKPGTEFQATFTIRIERKPADAAPIRGGK
jgi:hypothetical protein